MITYQDFEAAKARGTNMADFILRAISEHKSSELYQIAVVADEYARQRNRTIVRLQKMLYDVYGMKVVDKYSSNYKIPSNFFSRFTIQEVQHLLANGVVWQNPATKDKLGKNFDVQLQKLALMALQGGVAFGFQNQDKLEIFSVLEFVPLYSEENGALMAGIRFWQIDEQKPLRATVYEIDGCTDYMWQKGTAQIVRPKRAYKVAIRKTDIDGTEIFDGGNYPTFPIVPLWGSPLHQSEIIGMRGAIDAYDIIKSGFANNINDAADIYWTLENCGGMDEEELAKFVQRMHTIKATNVDGGDGAKAEAHTMEVPYQSREACLDRIEKDLYKDYMALNTETIAAGAATATQIQAAYEPLNNKVDMFEFCIIDFLHGILAVLGIDDEPSFKRSMVINQTEQTEMILMAANYLDDETIISKLPFITPEEVEMILERKAQQDVEKFEKQQEMMGGDADENNVQARQADDNADGQAESGGAQ